MVYLHAGLEIGSTIPYAFHWESTTLDIPSGRMPWVMACCHTGCLLFIEGMNTRMGGKAACAAKGEIMDRTKSRITPDEPEEQIQDSMAFNPWSDCYHSRPFLPG